MNHLFIDKQHFILDVKWKVTNWKKITKNLSRTKYRTKKAKNKNKTNKTTEREKKKTNPKPEAIQKLRLTHRFLNYSEKRQRIQSKGQKRCKMRIFPHIVRMYPNVEQDNRNCSQVQS